MIHWMTGLAGPTPDKTLTACGKPIAYSQSQRGKYCPNCEAKVTPDEAKGTPWEK